MKRIFILFLIAVAGYAVISGKATASPDTDEGFVPLFNGNNLDGWVNVNCAPETWVVKDGMIVCSGFPTGVLRTEKLYPGAGVASSEKRRQRRLVCSLRPDNRPGTAVHPFYRGADHGRQ